jgi:excisionase family DNA binding protein
MSAAELYSVEQVAQRLGLHVRTVRGYVRDGRLKAVRIGKQYRIAREDLEALTGRPVTGADAESARRSRYVEVSSVVQVDAIDRDAAGRVSNVLMAATHARGEGGPVRVDTIYDEVRARLKIIVTGEIATTVGLLQLVALHLDQPR